MRKELRGALGALACLIGATLLLLVVTGASGRSAARTATAAAAPSFEILPRSVCPSGEVAIGRACVQLSGYGDEWSQSDGSATWTHPKMNPQWTVTAGWTVPDMVLAASADVTLSIMGVEMTHDPNASICPAVGFGAGSGFTIVGQQSLGVCAQNDQNGQGNPSSKSNSVTVKLIPSSGARFLDLVIGVQDGPVFTYTYALVTPPLPGCEHAGGAPDARPAALNEVIVVACVPDCQFHKGGTPADAWLPINRGQVLKQGDEITCDPDGSVTMAFGDNSTVTVSKTTQLKIASFFTEGGVVRTEILLKMGEVAAQVNKSEATKSDFRIDDNGPKHSGSVRGTIFTYFYDPGTQITIVSVKRGVVAVRASPGGPVTNVPAGKEVEVTKTVSALAPIGKAGARGGIDILRARDLVLAVVARHNAACRATTPRTGAFSVEPAPGGWLVAVKLLGGLRGTSNWRVTATRVKPANALARKLARSCH